MTQGKVFRTHSNAFVNLSIYEQRIQRGIDKAMKQLSEIQTGRKALRRREMDDAVRMRHFHDMLQRARQAENKATPISHLPYDPKEDQFVYSSAEIEAEVRRRDRAKQALLAATVGFNYAEYLEKAA